MKPETLIKETRLYVIKTNPINSNPQISKSNLVNLNPQIRPLDVHQWI